MVILWIFDWASWSDKRMRAQWRDEQERCERDIERHRAGRRFLYGPSIHILSLGQNAHRLFVAQPAREKRSLVNFVLSNSTWAQGKPSVEFNERFDLLAQTVEAATRGRSD
jgi:site-specific DNA recombinase